MRQKGVGNYWKYRHSARFPSYGASIRYVLDNYVKHAVPCWSFMVRPATLSTSTICSSWSIGLASSRTKKRRVHSIKWRHVPVIMSYVGFERGVFESWNLPYINLLTASTATILNDFERFWTILNFLITGNPDPMILGYLRSSPGVKARTDATSRFDTPKTRIRHFLLGIV